MKTLSLILTQKKFDCLIEKINKTNIFAFHLEMNFLDIFSTKIVGISISLISEYTAYLPLSHDYENAPEQLDTNVVLKYLKPLFENVKIYKISRNIKQQILILKNHNIILNNIFDINLESYVLNNLSGKF
ncbi:MAG: DNA polymerase I, partial [Pantoea sp. Edef]|nr:DNA polymerase I [Pantoea sp. Edef]